MLETVFINRTGESPRGMNASRDRWDRTKGLDTDPLHFGT